MADSYSKYIGIICLHENMKNGTKDDKVMLVRKIRDHRILASRAFKCWVYQLLTPNLSLIHLGSQEFCYKRFSLFWERDCCPPCTRWVSIKCVVTCSIHQLRNKVSEEHDILKKKELESGPKASHGYGGRFGVERDRMDKVSRKGEVCFREKLMKSKVLAYWGFD